MKKLGFKSRLILGTTALLLGCGSESTPPEVAPQAPTPDGLTVEVDAYVTHRDSAVNLPTVAWLQPRHGIPVGSSAKDIALGTLRGLAKPYRLSEQALKSAQLRDVHDAGNGPLIAHFDQQVDGMEVFRTSMKIGMDRGATPVIASGYLAPKVQPITTTFALDETAAVAAAFRAMQNGKVVVKTVHRTKAATAEDRYAALAVEGSAAAGVTMTGPARSKKLWYPTAAGLLPAYYVELSVGRSDSTESQMHALVVSAVNGDVLFTKNLTASDAFTYRVWADNSGRYTPWDSPAGNDFSPHPTGLDDSAAPTGVKPAQLVTLQNAPFNFRNDPWLPADATDANGNNVFAYADLKAPDGFSAGDLRITTTAPKTFDTTIDPTVDSAPAVAQGVGTHLFYVLNYMHDFFYEAGWTEASLNSQKDNFGRGGLGGDAIKAEAQDYGSTNNANASTPADGSPVRIQMYLWTPAFVQANITAPPALVKVLKTQSAQYNPKNYDLTKDVVAVDDGTATPTLGCGTTFANAAALAGKIALINRGTCSFVIKSKNAQVNGAAGVLIADNMPGGSLPGMGGTDATITIPSVGITFEDGAAIRASLTAGTAVTVHLQGNGITRDGSLDTGIVAHEWGHTMSNRLIGNASGISNNQGGGMGEGWSDFVAMLTIVRPEDTMVAANANWDGAYPVGAWAEWALGSKIWYEGIRRYPYSADLSKNPLTFKHIEEGVALPATPPPLFGADGSDSSEVHSTGEVWTSMLWECYVALLRDTSRYTFEQANLRMRQYLVASLKLTPNAPTLVEARDAVLAAAFATDQQDFQLFWTAFAKRGIGVNAVAPDRNDDLNTGVVESFVTGNDLSIESITIDDSVKSCDHDGVLDNNETGLVNIKLRNTGSADLTATTIQVTSNLAAVTLSNSGTINVPTIRPLQSATVTIPVSMSGATGITPFDIQAVATDPMLATPRMITLTYQALGNYDDVLKSSATGGATGNDPAWTVGNDPELDTSEGWTRQSKGRGTAVWFCPDHNGTSDYYLVTPPLQVNATGNFTFSVQHSYDWEADDSVVPPDYYDGSVIEISADAGATWTDLGAQLTMNGYNATLVSTADGSDNPLAGRKAFGLTSPGFPAYITTTADLGTTYAGKTVQVRFRGASDQLFGFTGWFVNQVAFQNLQNTPFASRVADRGMCTSNGGIVVKASSPTTTVPSGYLVELAASTTQTAGKPVTFTWSQVSGPTVTLSTLTGANTHFNAPTVSGDTPVVFQVVASDGTATSDPQQITITVVTAGGPISPSSGCSYGGPLPSPASAAALSSLLLAGAALLARRRRK